MKAKIGTRLLAQITPREKPFHVRDNEIPGFLVRVQPTGLMVYYYEFRFEGRRCRIRLGRVGVITVPQAREAARAKAAILALGSDPRPVRKNNEVPTLEVFLREHFAPWARLHRKSGDVLVQRIRTCFGEFLKSRLDAISRPAIENWRTRRLATGTRPLTINRDLTCLRGALSRAVEWEILKEHPLRNLKFYRVDTQERLRFLSPSEEKRLRVALKDREERIRNARRRGNSWRLQRGRPLMRSLDELPFVDHLRPVVLLALGTGVRRGELLRLRWGDIDFDTRTIHVRAENAKNSRGRWIPMSSEIITVLRGWEETCVSRWGELAPEFYLFPGETTGRITDIKKAWANLLKSAEIKDFRFHDLRHSFASKLVQRGVPLNTVRDLLGHRSLALTLRYSHLGPDARRKAVEKLNPDTDSLIT